MSKPVYWAVGDEERLTATTLNDAVEQYLDAIAPDPLPLDDTITVVGYVRMTVTADPDRYLATLLEDLDEEYGDPEGSDETKITDGMRGAAALFVASVIKEYDNWACEPLDGSEVEVQVREWVTANAPEWLEEDVRADDGRG